MAAITDSFTVEIATALRSLIGERRKSVSGLALALGMSRSATSDRVNGNTALTAEQMDRAAKYLDLADAYELVSIAKQIADRSVAAQRSAHELAEAVAS